MGGGGEEKEGLRGGEGNGAIFSSFFQTTASSLGLRNLGDHPRSQ